MSLLLFLSTVWALISPCPGLFYRVVICLALFPIIMEWLWSRLLVQCVFLLSTVGLILDRCFAPFIWVGTMSSLAAIGSHLWMRDSMGLGFFGLRSQTLRSLVLVILGILMLEVCMFIWFIYICLNGLEWSSEDYVSIFANYPSWLFYCYLSGFIFRVS